MICAAHFNGPTAPQLANQMVLLIRSQYNMPAYVFNYADEERRQQRAILDGRRPRSSARPPSRAKTWCRFRATG